MNEFSFFNQPENMNCAPSLSVKRAIKPLPIEEQIRKVNQSELELQSRVFGIKRHAEVESFEPFDTELIDRSDIYKKCQYRHIRESEDVYKEDNSLNHQQKISGDNDLNLFIGKELGNIGKDGQNCSRTIMKKSECLYEMEDQEDFRRTYKTCYNEMIKKLKREDFLNKKRKNLMAQWTFDNKSLNELENNENGLKRLEVNICMEIEKDRNCAREEIEAKNNSYHHQALSEGWVYF